MLLELYGENFGCFRDEFRLSMLATDIDPGSNRGIIEARVEGDDEPLRLLRAVAIYGPNASGKSTVLRAAAGLRHLLMTTRELRSDAKLQPYEPFALGKSQESVRLGVKAVIDGRVYDYEVRFDRTHFLSERLKWLSADEERMLVDRQGHEAAGEWMEDERFALLTKDFRGNALLLTLADRLAPTLAKDIASGLRRMLNGFDLGPSHSMQRRRLAIAKRLCEDSGFGGWLLSRLKSADIGVEDLHAARIPGAIEADTAYRFGLPYRFSLVHRGEHGSFEIPYHLESGGTRRLVDLGSELYDLAYGPKYTALFIDEIGESLHPMLLKEMIDHFNFQLPAEDLRGQLIFATHETSLLDAEAKNASLRRDQVYLTEKDASGAARLYSVAEFRERNNLNLRRRYLQGRYGALPSLSEFKG